MRLPIAMAIIGVAAGAVGEVAPLYLPDTPRWVWGLVFWFGIATIAGALIWGVWPYRSPLTLRSFIRHLIDFLPTIKFTQRVSRMPIVQLRDLASEKYEWDFDGQENLHGIDFVEGLQQAGLDGTISFWGRDMRNLFSDLDRDEPLEQIDRSHWKDFQIEVLNLLVAEDNFNVQSRSYRTDDKGFADIHAERSSAIQWLKRDGEQFKGRKKR